MEILQLAKQMERVIINLGEEGLKSTKLIEAKATAMSEYDKELGLAIATMQANGDPVTTIEKQAKGQVFKALCNKIRAEEYLKAHHSRMDQLKAQLNGLQSMNRHLSEI